MEILLNSIGILDHERRIAVGYLEQQKTVFEPKCKEIDHVVAYESV
jgi:hypothetical protein